MGKTVFISGIDTDAGKSYVTGWLAAQLERKGERVATLKFIQTGNVGRSEDIEVHRAIMGHNLPEDSDLLTSPQIFSYPASPDLASRIDGRPIDFEAIDTAIARLAERYDVVLVEGAGGLAVPLTTTMLTIDYVAQREMPVILVTNGRLGSINHTVLSLEAIKSRRLILDSVMYNTYYDTDPEISTDTKRWIGEYLKREFPGVEMQLCPVITLGD
ncbi:MAG: dethiobiotin synthase [Candidatus Amulumruptor caecigallinarius]|nr:dethiobiotin synthase [Candidatus Amulumruptor caecigallinarius]MCM1397288.1 dethiobiotin synthase [Candidatus Amulumruptor caecigallinarius]MCM1453647.1 dethiobiotin synthase [bacterium]